MGSLLARALVAHLAAPGRRLTLALSLGLVSACASAPPPAARPAEPKATQAIAGGDLMALPPGQTAPSEAVPVGADDPQRGNATALVTVVEFADFQCPFCARVTPTLDRLLEVYGPEQVRVVWKNLPLPFHVHARPAAEMSAAVMKLGGNEAFWRFHRKAFENDGRQDEATLGELARSTGLDARTLAQAIAEHGTEKVRADEDLAGRLGVRGTPGFIINGIFLSGAQPFESFAEIVDAELVAAKQTLAGGTPQSRLYAARVAANVAKVPLAPEPPRAAPEADTRTVWQVPVDGSPVLGKADAPVTIVQLTDYQCPFCVRGHATIGELRTIYGDQIRIVHKHRPLPFHAQARPASNLAIEVLARKGEVAFWKANDLLFAAQRDMNTPAGDPDQAQRTLAPLALFGDIAEQLGVSRAQANAAITSNKHDARIARDEALADDLEAGGTPTFFINGRRLTGAQPAEKFKTIIDEELVKVKALVAAGTRPDRVYETIIAGGKKAELELETATLPAPTAANPSRGPVNAPVLIQVFSDFECPFCKRLATTLDELAKAHPKEVRIVFRHHPLPMHPNAQPAAEASMEAFAQGGSAAFWRMHDALFAVSGEPGALQRQGLEDAAKKAGIDVTRLRKALDEHKHQAAIITDIKLAEEKKLNGTPNAVVGGYLVGGAMPLAHWKRVVAKVLAEKKAGAAKR